MTDRKTLFVDVILPVPIRNEFTYRVPFELNDSIFTGARVVVPFGRSKLITGIVTQIHQNIPKQYQAKYIEHLLDERPIITPRQYTFWKWISSYYMAPIGDVLNAALPANFKLASETQIVLHPDYEVNPKMLTERELEIVLALEMHEKMDLKQISELIGIKTIQPVVKALIEKKAVISLEALNDKFIPKTAVYVTLTEHFLQEEILNSYIQEIDAVKSKEKQLGALLSLVHKGKWAEGSINPVLRKELLNDGVSQSSLNTLERNGIVFQQKREVSRFDEEFDGGSEFMDLTPAQKKSLEEIHNGFDEDKVVLLHGVTGSGKTEVYVQLIQEQLDLGKQVLFLLPEIALTTQLIQRLSIYFGEQIGVYHSKFNQNERVEIWNHVLNNDPNRFRIILGARSSIFLPYRDLGLIIVDEEHEGTFKQYDPSPRYNARDCSIVLGSLHKANVLLGSATPSIESYYNAKSDKYRLVELSERFGGLMLPEIQCANVRKERKQKSMQSDFTSTMVDHIREALNLEEQVILFQNRRGYTPLWMCEVCNWTPKCKSCDVSLTYHKHTNQLKCHYCGYTIPPVGTCSACGSNRLKMLGFGTEKVEDELGLIFPDKVIKRLDLDTTRSKNAYANILGDFAAGNIDILIGTQMVSKGLDFDNVNLVGILDADMLLNRANFRAFERSFQLMTQVAGRSGRRKKRGKVILQTGDPDHWVIQKVMDHDFISFYESEVIERQNFFYPPFYKVIQLTLRHRNENALNQGAIQLAGSMKEVFKERVLGPEFPVVRRINNYYLKTIVLKIERTANDKQVKERLQQIIDDFFGVPSHKSIRVVVDVDPA
ncbi:MAG: primosomal protein N' [Crocinitomicaceae bacterium]|nr:primosomal protein N' [Crocinitomicaceae bacterium]|tara:strand:- start:7833 stop:10316 length:2484 start_codon:yes stop_codon:yes gene_type:complete